MNLKTNTTPEKRNLDIARTGQIIAKTKGIGSYLGDSKPTLQDFSSFLENLLATPTEPQRDVNTDFNEFTPKPTEASTLKLSPTTGEIQEVSGPMQVDLPGGGYIRGRIPEGQQRGGFAQPAGEGSGENGTWTLGDEINRYADPATRLSLFDKFKDIFALESQRGDMGELARKKQEEDALRMLGSGAEKNIGNLQANLWGALEEASVENPAIQSLMMARDAKGNPVQDPIGAIRKISIALKSGVMQSTPAIEKLQSILAEMVKNESILNEVTVKLGGPPIVSTIPMLPDRKTLEGVAKGKAKEKENSLIEESKAKHAAINKTLQNSNLLGAILGLLGVDAQKAGEDMADKTLGEVARTFKNNILP
jgi:hypothetical protein